MQVGIYKDGKSQIVFVHMTQSEALATIASLAKQALHKDPNTGRYEAQCTIVGSGRKRNGEFSIAIFPEVSTTAV